MLKVPAPVSCAAGDYDNDEKPDVAIATAAGVSLFRNAGGGAFDTAAPLVVAEERPRQSSRAASASSTSTTTRTWTSSSRGCQRTRDVAEAAPVLLRNNGDGTFADVTAERGLGGLKTAGVTASDLNNDRAIDLVFTGPTVSILINPREGAYKALDAFKPPAPANTRGVVAFDFDKDGWMDLAFTHFEGARVAVAQRRGQGLRAGRRCRRPGSSAASG